MKILKFSAWLIVALILAGIIHASYFYANALTYDVSELVLCYAINYIMAIFIYGILLLLAVKRSTYLGFFFLFGSALKFGIYFLIIHPLLGRDGVLTYTDFFLFFVPYLICLFAETFALVNLLKKGG